jgi:IS4 transposase
MILHLPEHAAMGDAEGMAMDAILELFISKSPVTVMARAAMENALAPEALDALFAETAQTQYMRELLFSSVVDLMGMVVGKIRPSIRAAYEAVADTLPVTLTSIYNKINATEPSVVAELVRRTADRLRTVIDTMGGGLPAPLPGYRLRIIDGNHLASTERRLEPIRGSKAGPLPGFALVVLDPERMLATDMIPCEDGHAQERSLSQEILHMASAKDVWIADRNFCTIALLAGLAQRDSFFVIRRHANMPVKPTEPSRRCGRTDTGVVFEQKATITDSEGTPIAVRLVTVLLDKTTRDGDHEIAIVTNLSSAVASATAITELYRKRWTLETMFLTLTQILEGEIPALGHPRAALLGFGVALVSYNVYSTVQAALRAEFGAEKVEAELSGYAVANEVQYAMGGMDIAVKATTWKAFQKMTPEKLGSEMRRYASHVNLQRFKRTTRGPKKPRTPRTEHADKPHISTARILAASKARRSP